MGGQTSLSSSLRGSGAGALAAVGSAGAAAASQLPALARVTLGCSPLLPSELYCTVRVQPLASVVEE